MDKKEDVKVKSDSKKTSKKGVSDELLKKHGRARATLIYEKGASKLKGKGF